MPNGNITLIATGTLCSVLVRIAALVTMRVGRNIGMAG